MKTVNAADEDWNLLLSFFPSNWKELAQATGALKGLRQDKSEESYIRTLLLHLGCGFSMRETVVRVSDRLRTYFLNIRRDGFCGLLQFES